MSAEKIGDIKEQLKSITDSQQKSVWTSMRRSLSAQTVSRNMSVSTHHMLIFAA